ncbi:hypothetical protein [Acidovorax sp. CF316]|uniref:hypothetical protein n=1 Tax=Acidovorax sp. CF316 TaxID=1144317 RepID=UPI0011B2029E|nr:hypothetical protein [Acidovorax sp. CF316]
MAYRFTGFLARGLERVADSSELPADSIVRSIQTPFLGMGIALPSLAGKLLTISELLALANQTGIAAATAWMFIDYETWGRVDAVYAAGLADGSAFGPFDDSNGETVETTYLDAWLASALTMSTHLISNRSTEASGVSSWYASGHPILNLSP